MKSVARRQKFSPASRRFRSQRAIVEALEPRQMLTTDYVLAFTSHTLPGHIVEGYQAKTVAKLTLTNNSNTNFANAGKVDFKVFARPAGAEDASTDIQVGALLNQAVSSIKVGFNKLFNVNVTVPSTLNAGDFLLLAKVSTVPAGDEMSSSTAANGFTVDPAVLDLALSSSTETMPPTQISGSGVSNIFKVIVTNIGNIPTAKFEKAQVVIRAVPTGGGNYIEVGNIANQAIGSLAPGKAKTFTIKFTLPVSLVAGTYNIVATLTDQGPTPEQNATNNTATANSAISVTQGFIDLQTTINTSSIPPAILVGANATVTAQVLLTNLGNIAFSSPESAYVRLMARPVEGGDAVDLQILTSQNIAQLKPNVAKTVALKGNLSGLVPGTYEIVIEGTVNSGVDTNWMNDYAVAIATVIVDDPFVDLTVDSATDTLAPSVNGGASGNVTVNLKNLGNVDSVGYKVEVFATTDGNIPEGAIPVGTTQSTSAKIKPNTIGKVTVPISLPAPVNATTYTLVARVTFYDDIYFGNNEGSSGTVDVTATPPLLGDLLTTYQMTETSFDNLLNIQLTSLGTLRDADGNALLYGYSFTKTNGPVKTPGVFKILGGVGASHIITLTFNGTVPDSIDGKTIIFTKVKAGSSGSFECLASLTWNIPNDVTGYFKLI